MVIPMKRPSKLCQFVLGLLVLLVGGAVAVLLFLVNRVVVASICLTVLPGQSTQYAKLQTMLMLIMPVLLMLPEWWLLDAAGRMFGRLFRRRAA